MKKYLWCSISMIALFLTLAVSGMVYAADTAKDMAKSDIKMHDATPKQAAVESGNITVSGTINEENQLIDAQGKAFELSDSTEEGLEVKALIGQKVELKGTVLDESGQKTMEVREYKILEK